MKALLFLLITSTAFAKEIQFSKYRARVLDESPSKITLTFIRHHKSNKLIKVGKKDLCREFGKGWKQSDISFTEVFHLDTNTEKPVKDYETVNILECKK